MDGAVERDLARAKEELAKLGRQLPGDDAAEIARYVAERKRNWPRRRARAGAAGTAGTSGGTGDVGADAVSQLVSGYDEMSDVDSASDGEIRENTGAASAPAAASATDKKGRNHNNNNLRPNRPHNPGVFKNRDRRARKRNTLLGAILQKSIDQERFVLLEAFKHFMK